MNLKGLRTRMGLTQKQLADEMQTTQQTIARWETGKTPMNVDHIKDLCVVLQCTAQDLLGWETPAQELRYSPFSASEFGPPYGTMKLSLTEAEHAYPIEEKAKIAIVEQFERRGVMNATTAGKTQWIHAWTLDNRTLLVNPSELRKTRIVSDDIEGMPAYRLPEVYRAMADWFDVKPNGALRQECDSYIADVGIDQALATASDIRVIYRDGTVSSHSLSEAVANEVCSILVHGCHIEPGTFVLVESEEAGHDCAFINLDNVAILEVPSDLYNRLTAPEEGDQAFDSD
jgi:transcriptional regulator with XRE-family HTH domain